MNKKQRKKLDQKANQSFKLAHILIAVVAIFECLILIAFTTYSWIESASSLIIMNGPQSTTTTDNVNIDIANALNYEIDLDAGAGSAQLINFFSSTKYYRYGKASSADGETMYFPKKNNTYTAATAYRKGDTTDFNTSYSYFDFQINNNVGNKDFYFNDDTQDKQNVFKVIDPSGYFSGKTYSINEGGTTQSYNKTEAIRRAMRISIVDTSAGETNKAIYSPTGKSYSAQSGTSSSSTAAVSIRKISDYFISANHPNQEKLFTSKKNKTIRVQVRIWLELNDPDFVAAFGAPSSAQYSDDDYKAIAGTQIEINLSLGNADNNFRPFYFDDYTFSNTSGNVGGHLTDDYQNYKLWFHCSNPDNTSQFNNYEMTREETSGGRTRWSCDTVSQTVTDYLCDTIPNVTQCYFAYGQTVGGTATYTWPLTEKPTSGTTEFIYNAYGRYLVNSTYYCSGVWNDRSTMHLIQFKDYGTMLVSDDFNRSSSNFQIIKQNPVDHLFVTNQATYNASGTNHYGTASMFYDSTNEIFKSFVPQTWLSSNVYFRFNLGNTGYSGIDLSFGSTPVLSNGTDYIYTALGQDENYTLAYYDQHNADSGNSNYIAPGFGTWGDIEQIHLNAELIDYDIKASDRFKVSIAGTDIDSTAKESIPLIPDATGMVYSAYIPAGSGVTASPFLKFVRLNGVNNNNAVNGRWLSTARNASDTYYPVKVDSAALGEDTTRGYWNLSVLVDGTYENLIYDTLTDGDEQGRLEYSFDGSTYVTLTEDSDTAGSPNPDDNRISAYRWYVPCSEDEIVYYRWTPYYGDDGQFGGNDDTSFVFTHNTANGMYCVITEPENAVTIAQNTPSEQRRSMSLAATGFEANVEQSLSEQMDDSAIKLFPSPIDAAFADDLRAAEKSNAGDTSYPADTDDSAVIEDQAYEDDPTIPEYQPRTEYEQAE